MSISRILIETSFIFKGTFYALLMRLLVTAKSLFCSFDRNVSKPQKRYLFRAFEEIASTWKKGTFFALLKRSLQPEKKVPFSRFKVLFGKVRNGWKADNIDVKIFSPESLKYPPFFSKKAPFFNFSHNRLALTKKVTILHVVLWKVNAES